MAKVFKKHSEFSKEKIYFLSGSYAGLITAMLKTPFDLIKIRLQSNINSHDSFIDITKKINREKGPLFFFKGFTVTINRELLSSGMYTYTYFSIKDYLIFNKYDNIFNLFVAGGIAGVFSIFLCFPFDPIKTIIQNEDKYISQYTALNTIINSSGYRGLYKGLIPLAIRAFYINGIVFLVNDMTKYYILNLLNT